MSQRWSISFEQQINRDRIWHEPNKIYVTSIYELKGAYTFSAIPMHEMFRIQLTYQLRKSMKNMLIT